MPARWMRWKTRMKYDNGIRGWSMKMEKEDGNRNPCRKPKDIISPYTLSTCRLSYPACWFVPPPPNLNLQLLFPLVAFV